MGVGEFNAAERFQIDEAIRKAELVSRVEFSVFVGRVDGEPRAFATQLHNRLVAPPRSILIMLDPAARVLEIVTGGDVRRNLTDREVEVLRLASKGMSRKDVADILGITENTVRHHLEHIYGKTGTTTRVGATLFAMENNLLI